MIVIGDVVATHAEVAAAFDRWAADYAANPERYEPVLNADGTAREGYGEWCVRHLVRLLGEPSA